MGRKFEEALSVGKTSRLFAEWSEWLLALVAKWLLRWKKVRKSGYPHNLWR
jgi:hypothetical protein